MRAIKNDLSSGTREVAAFYTLVHRQLFRGLLYGNVNGNIAVFAPCFNPDETSNRVEERKEKKKKKIERNFLPFNANRRRDTFIFTWFFLINATRSVRDRNR